MIRRLASGLLPLCLTLCAGCSGNVRHVPVPVREVATPPPALMAHTPRPVWNGTTNADLLDFAQEAVTALDRCNADKEAMRTWATEATR
ncbi:Rz1-like lysis system protein LysC [Nitratidesulfovibrio vulgaris]|uniref:Rz1-like lysis system protein LysC n=1 Tax=Nitratidesulfovibrio vulgaris TaxID=881 RepID=UPI0013E0B677|nr:Rz1-like lysis system protein LysC [Nitratidesulfovibrio vulgaris]